LVADGLQRIKHLGLHAQAGIEAIGADFSHPGGHCFRRGRILAAHLFGTRAAALLPAVIFVGAWIVLRHRACSR
jgi:hypothetical protein